MEIVEVEPIGVDDLDIPDAIDRQEIARKADRFPRLSSAQSSSRPQPTALISSRSSPT
jgi:hypothetical protein